MAFRTAASHILVCRAFSVNYHLCPSALVRSGPGRGYAVLVNYELRQFTSQWTRKALAITNASPRKTFRPGLFAGAGDDRQSPQDWLPLSPQPRMPASRYGALLVACDLESAPHPAK